MKGAPQRRLSELVFPLRPELQDELEAFRITFEKANGATDLTKRYTSTWPQEDQAVLSEADFERYFDGFPPFAKAYIFQKMKRACMEGRLDDEPREYVAIYVSGFMEQSTRRGRSR